MNILHICCNYSTTELYKNVITKLWEKGNYQYVYVPLRDSSLINKNLINCDNLDFNFLNILRPYHRILYKLKIAKTTKHLIHTHHDLQKFNVIHAHTLFSDGGVAYNLFKRFSIPYIISVRNTDINIFYRYMVHLREFSFQILKNAKKIIFINPSYKDELINNILPKKYRNIVEEKSEVIPNGISDFWFKNSGIKDRNDFEINKLLFVGQFTRNKNIIGLINTVTEANKKLMEPTYLTLIGKDRNDRYSGRVERLASTSNKVKIQCRLSNKEELRRFYQISDIYIMISLKETFGLTYIEAMSQGLPVIYTKGQGIDGFFKDGYVGFAVNPKDKEEIIAKIREININYEMISDRCKKAANDFNWNDIANQYLAIYLE
ncbi:MAG: glycosyltransferase family 4 protein [Bacteroidales bacterium]